MNNLLKKTIMWFELKLIMHHADFVIQLESAWLETLQGATEV